MRICAILVGLCFGAVAACGQVLFHDDFEDGNAVGWEEYDGTFSVIDGAYRIQSNGFCGDARSVIGSAVWSDYVVQCDFNMLNREKTAALFHVEEIASGCDAGRYYQFEVLAAANKVEFCEMAYSGGSCNRLITQARSVSDNEWHHLRLEVQGTTATASIDGQQVLTYDAFTAYRAGRVGLKTVNSGITLFDNVLISAAPDTFSITAVEPVPFLSLEWEEAAPGSCYTVEYHHGDGSWLPIPPADQWPIASTHFSDPTAVQAWLEQGRRFYRVKAEPAPPPTGVVVVPAGSFAMGNTYGPGQGDETPVHDVHVSEFSIERTEVTNAKMAEVMQWAWDHGLVTANTSTVLNDEGSQHELLDLDDEHCQIGFAAGVFTAVPGKENFPCVEVSWYGALAYCNYRSDMEELPRCIDFSDWNCDFTKNGYRLPTEAEWEKAARGGRAGHYYPWPSYGGSYSDHIDGSKANYRSSGDPYDSGEWPRTTPVGYYPGHAYDDGLYDMAGNVWEWVCDWYDSNWYSNPASNDPDTAGPTGPLTERLIRGASWYEEAVLLQCAGRDPQDPSDTNESVGFRAVKRAP